MSPATHPRPTGDDRLLVADPSRGTLADSRGPLLATYLRTGDLLVVNDAATLPASLHGDLGGAPIEARLTSGADLPHAWAVLFGEGDWRTRTEDRPRPPEVRPGATLRLGALAAEVLDVSPVSPRLVRLRFDGAGESLVAALYRAGRPVQYSYAREDLRVWDVQTAYAARPWAVELPSAGRGLDWRLLGALRARGVEVATLTHAAGLSSTGSPELDALLPLPERYEIPSETARAVLRARADGARVIAVGTSVVRALESAVLAGTLGPSGASGLATLRIGEGFRPCVVTGLLTGMHEPGTSHFDLLHAFAPAPFLDRLDAHADRERYLGHEFGDHTLLVAA